MNVLFPRLPRPTAQLLFQDVGELSPATEHQAQVFAPVGGRRAAPTELSDLAESIRTLAAAFGFPYPLSKTDRLDFDRRSARLLVEKMHISWSEAAAPDLWSFLALILLPDVTDWRFGRTNSERWVASDLTRHIWARAWWRGTVFASRPDLFDALTESDMNQMLERRVIGGDPRLVTAIAEALLHAEALLPGHRRYLIRSASARLRRRLAFIDARALDDSSIAQLCTELFVEASRHLPDADPSETAVDPEYDD